MNDNFREIARRIHRLALWRKRHDAHMLAEELSEAEIRLLDEIAVTTALAEEQGEEQGEEGALLDAAPALLEALRELVEAVEHEYGSTKTTDWPGLLMDAGDQAQAAIAAATGGEPAPGHVDNTGRLREALEEIAAETTHGMPDVEYIARVASDALEVTR